MKPDLQKKKDDVELTKKSDEQKQQQQ